MVVALRIVRMVVLRRCARMLVDVVLRAEDGLRVERDGVEMEDLGVVLIKPDDCVTDAHAGSAAISVPVLRVQGNLQPRSIAGNTPSLWRDAPRDVPNTHSA